MSLCFFGTVAGDLCTTLSEVFDCFVAGVCVADTEDIGNAEELEVQARNEGSVRLLADVAEDLADAATERGVEMDAGRHGIVVDGTAGDARDHRKALECSHRPSSPDSRHCKFNFNLSFAYNYLRIEDQEKVAANLTSGLYYDIVGMLTRIGPRAATSVVDNCSNAKG
jgi:hypothetical protein